MAKARPQPNLPTRAAWLGAAGNRRGGRGTCRRFPRSHTPLGAEIRSHAAAASSYSWMSPPSRSRAPHGLRWDVTPDLSRSHLGSSLDIFVTRSTLGRFTAAKPSWRRRWGAFPSARLPRCDRLRPRPEKRAVHTRGTRKWVLTAIAATAPRQLGRLPWTSTALGCINALVTKGVVRGTHVRRRVRVR